jgi:hypothetical protein
LSGHFSERTILEHPKIATSKLILTCFHGCNPPPTEELDGQQVIRFKRLKSKCSLVIILQTLTVKLRIPRVQGFKQKKNPRVQDNDVPSCGLEQEQVRSPSMSRSQ